MHTSTSLAGNDRLPIYPLEVFRIKPGESWFVKMLGERQPIRGCFTHWMGRFSVYCPGTGCEPNAHKRERIWKGYTACEVWYPEPPGFWRPYVLEVTEHAELEMRHKYQRGQVWELSCAPATKTKHFPVVARLSEEITNVPADFETVLCLLRFYHRTDGKIDLSNKNPLPDRVFVTANPGNPPSEQAEKPRIIPADKETMEQFRRRMGLAGIPVVHKNGSSH